MDAVLADGQARDPQDVVATAAVPTHVLAWFPGDLLCGDVEASCWELFTRREWENSSLGDFLPGDLPQDATPDALRAQAEAELGCRVVEFRADTWRAALPTPNSEPGPWHVYPAYMITAATDTDDEEAHEEGEVLYRDDVRTALASRGWSSADEHGSMRKNNAWWTAVNVLHDSVLESPFYSVEFSGGVPAPVVVAACEAAAEPGDSDADTLPLARVPDKGRRAEALLQRLRHRVGDERWDRWPAAHREAFGAAMTDMTVNPDGTLSFGPGTPVPAWVRREFDGRMHRSACPSLALASIWEPRDWARLLAGHPEMRLTNHYYDAAPYPQAILAAHELLRERGLEPWLDVELELNLFGGQIVPDVGTGALYTPHALPAEAEAEVSALLGEGAALLLDTPTPRGEGMNGWEWW